MKESLWLKSPGLLPIQKSSNQAPRSYNMKTQRKASAFRTTSLPEKDKTRRNVKTKRARSPILVPHKKKPPTCNSTHTSLPNTPSRHQSTHLTKLQRDSHTGKLQLNPRRPANGSTQPRKRQAPPAHASRNAVGAQGRDRRRCGAPSVPLLTHASCQNQTFRHSP